MGLWLLANTVGRDAAELRYTNSSNTEQPATNLDNLRGGPRSLKFDQGALATRRYVYLNKAGGLAASHMVVANAAALEGLATSIMSWDAYPGSLTSYSTYDAPASFSEPTYGIDGSDWVWAHGVGVSNRQAFGFQVATGGTGIDLLKIYFCQGMEFDYAAGTVQFQRVPVHAQAVQHCGNFYKLHATASLTLGPITRAGLDTYYGIPKDDPVFLFDDTGGEDYGDHIPHKLWHCVIMGEESVVEYSDNSEELIFVSIEIGILKHGNG